MAFVFPLINVAISDLVEYYEIDNIKMFYENFTGSSTYTIRGKNMPEIYNEHTKRVQADMDTEITQHIHGSSHNVLVQLFEYLENWLNDVRIEKIDIAWIEKRIDKHNNWIISDFSKKQQEIGDEFIKGLDTTRIVGVEYETIVKNNLLPFFNPFKTKVTHRLYHCVESTPNVIEYSEFIVYYGKVVKEVVNGFVQIIQPYLKQWKNDLIKANSTVIIQQSTSNIKPLHSPKKLKVKLNVKQLSYLFKLLDEEKLIDTKSKMDLFRLIAENFATIGKDSISENNIRNHFNSPEKATAKFWAKHLSEMLKRARNL